MFIAAIVVAASCTKPVLIGSDFLEDEKSSLNFLDSFDLTFHTLRTDSVVVHSDNVSKQLIVYLLGHLNDPIFGRSTAEIYAQPLLPGQGSVLRTTTENPVTLDSVVLQLRYDTLGLYGTLSDPVTIEVYRMRENPDFREDYFSNDSFMTDGVLLGSLTFIPKPYDSVEVIRPSDTTILAPHVRIPLDNFIMSELLLQDSVVFTNQDSFLHYFNGLHIKMTGAENTMLGFNLLNQVSGLSYYYDKEGSQDQEFKFIFADGSIKTVHMDHDYAGSFVEPSLTPDPETDLWFVQGMSGLTTTLTVGGLEQLGNAIINQAELEVYCTFPDGDVPALYPPVEYLVTQDLTDTAIYNSVDVSVALIRASGNHISTAYETIFGGALEKVTDGPPAVYRYNMKITSQLKDIYLGKKENIIYFNPFDKANTPRRSVMFGPSHPEFAPRLRIYYTSL